MASPAPAWSSTLGFSERFAVIDKIASLLKQTQPLLQHSDALKSAQKSESECLNNSSSQEEYIKLWQARLEELKDQQQQTAETSTTGHGNHSNNGTHDGDIFWEADRSGSPGVTIGSYISAKPFASGLFSTIYKAHRGPESPISLTTTRCVALKETNPSVMSAPHDSRREARLLKQAKHPNVLQLLETFNSPPSLFVLVSPFYPHDLGALLASDSRTVTHHQLRSILRDALRGLSHVHSLGIIHRDIKPSNILLSSLSGPAYLADFGIAWSSTDPACEPEDQKITDVGTTCYRPPELLFGYKAYGSKVDMWAFGCVVAECFSPGHEQLFDAGDLGSDLRLIASIFKKLGTPTLETWPEASKFPDFGKIAFHAFPSQPWHQILPETPEAARELVEKLVMFESAHRVTAQEALDHPLFRFEELDVQVL
ncbi:mitogen-activated protein kinase [Rhizina undulata]